MATIIRIGLQLMNIFINDYFLYYLIYFFGMICRKIEVICNIMPTED